MLVQTIPAKGAARLHFHLFEACGAYLIVALAATCHIPSGSFITYITSPCLLTADHIKQPAEDVNGWQHLREELIAELIVEDNREISHTLHTTDYTSKAVHYIVVHHEDHIITTTLLQQFILLIIPPLDVAAQDED
jgi:cellobiose-specific phosphotransferase system component IIA